MSLKQILEQIKEKRAEASIDPMEVDPRTRAGAEANVRNAKEDLPRLEAQYRREVESAILLINVTGPGAEQFGKIAREKLKVLSYDYKSIVQRLAEAVRARGGRDTFTTTESHLLLSEFLTLKVAYGIAVLPPLKINEISPTANEQELETAIGRLVEFTYGAGLYDIVTLREAQQEALNAKFSGRVFPIVVYNYDGSLDGRVLPTPAFSIEAGEKVSQNFVKEQLLKIREQLSPSPALTKETNA